MNINIGVLRLFLGLGQYGKNDTIRFTICTKQYAIRIDETIQW